MKNPSPDDVHKLLLNLGYEDFSDKKHCPSGNRVIDTYICYVQNYLGIMDGEDVVSNMGVFITQEDIDSWLTEQLAETKETGFEPEDDPSMYLGMKDYELHMSKGKERRFCELRISLQAIQNEYKILKQHCIELCGKINICT